MGCLSSREDPETVVSDSIIQLDLFSDSNNEKREIAVTAFRHDVNVMKNIAIGKENQVPNTESCDKLADSIIRHKLMLKIIENFPKIEKESRNDIVSVFTALLKRDNGKISSEYIKNEGSSILDKIIKHYEDPDLSISCGTLIREFFRIDIIAVNFLKSEHLNIFFTKLLNSSNFDVVSDAFSSFKQCLTTNKNLIAQHLAPTGDSYKHFFASYNKLLQEENFATKRFGLKLLGELFIEKVNYEIMMEYINQVNNLILIMNVLRINSQSIQLEAFNVFKIFVANPRKTKPIQELLFKNKDKLVSFLEQLLPEKEDDQFVNEKTLLVTTLKDLKEP